MAKVVASEALMRVADRCVQVMGGIGFSAETIVEQAFREARASMTARRQALLIRNEGGVRR